MPPTLYLIDGHALAYRMYYALTRGDASRFQTSQGEPTAGIYGFISVLLRILERENPDYLAVAFDTGKTFRDEIFPEYNFGKHKGYPTREHVAALNRVGPSPIHRDSFSYKGKEAR